MAINVHIILREPIRILTHSLLLMRLALHCYATTAALSIRLGLKFQSVGSWVLLLLSLLKVSSKRLFSESRGGN